MSNEESNQLENEQLDTVVGGASFDAISAELQALEEYEKKTGGGIVSDYEKNSPFS